MTKNWQQLDRAFISRGDEQCNRHRINIDGFTPAKSNFRHQTDPTLPCNIQKAKLSIEMMKNEQQLNRTYISCSDERCNRHRIKINNQTTARSNFRRQINPALPRIIPKDHTKRKIERLNDSVVERLIESVSRVRVVDNTHCIRPIAISQNRDCTTIHFLRRIVPDYILNSWTKKVNPRKHYIALTLGSIGCHCHSRYVVMIFGSEQVLTPKKY